MSQKTEEEYRSLRDAILAGDDEVATAMVYRGDYKRNRVSNFFIQACQNNMAETVHELYESTRGHIDRSALYEGLNEALRCGHKSIFQAFTRNNYGAQESTLLELARKSIKNDKRLSEQEDYLEGLANTVSGLLNSEEGSLFIAACIRCDELDLARIALNSYQPVLEKNDISQQSIRRNIAEAALNNGYGDLALKLVEPTDPVSDMAAYSEVLINQADYYDRVQFASYLANKKILPANKKTRRKMARLLQKNDGWTRDEIDTWCKLAASKKAARSI